MGRLKGNLQDQLLLSIIFLAFSIVIIFSYTIWSAMSPALNVTLSAANGGVLSPGTALVMNQTNTTLLMFDQLFVFMIIGSFIAIIISAFWLDTHPVYFIISFILLIFIIGIYAILGNIYGQIETATGLQAAASNYPLMEEFWSNAPTIALLFAIPLIIVLYSKMRGKSGNAYSA